MNRFYWNHDSLVSYTGVVKDTFREEDHPRDPKGTTTGGQFASKNATAAPSKPKQKGPSTDELLQKENKGTGKERVDMRRALKTEQDPMKKDALRKKIVDSMKLQYDKTGDASLLAKMDKYSKLYGLPNPMSGTSKAPTISEIKKTPGVVVPEKSKYTTEEIRTYDLLKKFDGDDNARTWMRFARDKKAAGDKLGLTFEELAYAQTYTGHGYRKVNAQLRSGVIDDSTYEYATRMDRVIDKLPVHGATTYRGVDFDDPKDVEKYKPGKVVVEAAFTSTSKDIKYRDSKSHGFIIRGRSGRDISSVSKFPSEQEILFKKNTAFRVTKREGRLIYLEEVNF